MKLCLQTVLFMCTVLFMVTVTIGFCRFRSRLPPSSCNWRGWPLQTQESAAMRFESRSSQSSSRLSSYSSSGYAVRGSSKNPGLRRVFSDILMIAFWGAMIPGFLWIGNAAGF